MGETDLHRKVISDLIETLSSFYEGQKVYVSGNLLLFYRPGNKRRHVSPDVLVTKGLEMKLRKNYLLWQEGFPPNIVIEITSATTRDEDIEDKFEIYRDEIRVAEYFLFDPFNEYLVPQLQGWRLLNGAYHPVEAVDGRFFSEQLGLQLQSEGAFLRLYDPQTNKRLATPQESRKLAQEEQRIAVEAQHIAEAEAERLRQELAELKKKVS
jgi:Uma2 family endonuclease